MRESLTNISSVIMATNSAAERYLGEGYRRGLVTATWKQSALRRILLRDRFRPSVRSDPNVPPLKMLHCMYKVTVVAP